MRKRILREFVFAACPSGCREMSTYNGRSIVFVVVVFLVQVDVGGWMTHHLASTTGEFCKQGESVGFERLVC